MSKETKHTEAKHTETKHVDVTIATVVHHIPEMEAVTVDRDVQYASSVDGVLTLDLYRSIDEKPESRCPVVVLVSGYPDPGFEKVTGRKFKEMGSSTSWGRLLAASGLVAITYTNRDPTADLERVLGHLRSEAVALGIDENRIGLWACSGNVPLALATLMRDTTNTIRCAALSYGFMLDVGPSTHVADAAAQFHFANPCAGTSADDLPKDVPLFLTRAGQDALPGLNETIDHFMAGALAYNLPVTLANLPSAPHAFDVVDDSEASREVIRRILAFLRFHLLA